MSKRLTKQEKEFLSKLKQDFEKEIDDIDLSSVPLQEQSEFANKEHEHKDYSTSNHSHPLPSHKHKEYASNNHDHPFKQHRHDADYATTIHDHPDKANRVHPHPEILVAADKGYRDLSQRLKNLKADIQLYQTAKHAKEHVIGHDKIPLVTEKSRGLAGPDLVKRLNKLEEEIVKLRHIQSSYGAIAPKGSTGTLTINGDMLLVIQDGIIKDFTNLNISGGVDPTPGTIDGEDGVAMQGEGGEYIQREAAA